MEEKKNEQRELGRDEVYAEVQEVINNVEKARMVAEGGGKERVEAESLSDPEGEGSDES